MATLRGESLLAVTGITAALKPGPVRINIEVLGKADGITRAIRRKLRKFLRTPGFTEMADPPEFDYQEIVDLLPGADNEARNVENVAGFRDATAAQQYAEALGAAMAYVQTIAPAELLPAMVGGRRMEPSALDMSEFRRRYNVVDRPLLLFDDMLAGPLTPDQVEALEAVYPNLYQAAREMIPQEMVDAKTARPTFELSYDKDQVLQIFLKTDTVDAKLSDDLNKAFNGARERESGQKTAAPSTPQRKGIGDPSTMSERLEAK